MTTRCPWSTARASVPAWMIVSSSGWAWRATMVATGSGYGAGLAELCDPVGVAAGVRHDLGGVLPGVGRWPADLAGGAAEAGRRARLGDARHLDERAPGHVVGVGDGLGDRQHRREAHVAALHDLAPLVPGLGPEHG